MITNDSLRLIEKKYHPPTWPKVGRIQPVDQNSIVTSNCKMGPAIITGSESSRHDQVCLDIRFLKIGGTIKMIYRLSMNEHRSCYIKVRINIQILQQLSVLLMLKKYFHKTGKATLTYKIAQSVYYTVLQLKVIHKLLFIRRKIKNKLSQTKITKIQFGAGSSVGREAIETNLPEFIDTDLLGEFPVDITKRLPLDNCVMNVIFSCHLIEHVHEFQINFFVRECFRILKSGGIMITATPDLAKICKDLYGSAKQLNRQPHYNRHAKTLLGKKPTPARILNGLMHIHYGHKFVMDFETFHDIASAAGFTDISQCCVNDIPDQSVKTFLRQRSCNFLNETAIWIAYK